MTTPPVFATSTGCPVQKYDLETVQLLQTNDPAPPNEISYGPQLLQDITLLDNFRHFNRERIPERVLHAKGAGAHGYFIPTKDLSDYTIALPFQPESLHKKVPATVRFSTVTGEAGSADTVRTFRGFAIKLKTDLGNWDWVFINFPVFPIRDPAKFISLAHVEARNPRTHLSDPDRLWDAYSSNPETIFQILYTYSDIGITKGYAHQNAYSVNPFSWINKDGVIHYVKTQLKAPKIEFLYSKEAEELAGKHPDYNTYHLYHRIAKGHFPKWTVEIQVMSLQQAAEWTEESGFSVFDATKIWPAGRFQPIEIGELVLDSNPKNYFAEVEQLAFAPSNLIPGVIPSPDPILQTRLFVYPDTQCYRLGVNLQQLPANKPICPIANFHNDAILTERDGFMAFNNQEGIPDYNETPDTNFFKFDGPYPTQQKFTGSTTSYLSELTLRDFVQPAEFWNSLSDDEKKRLIQNLKDSLGLVSKTSRGFDIILRQLNIFATVDWNLAIQIAEKLGIPRELILHIHPLRLPP